MCLFLAMALAAIVTGATSSSGPHQNIIRAFAALASMYWNVQSANANLKTKKAREGQQSGGESAQKDEEKKQNKNKKKRKNKKSIRILKKTDRIDALHRVQVEILRT